jgi:hypothetical protein
LAPFAASAAPVKSAPSASASNIDAVKPSASATDATWASSIGG